MQLEHESDEVIELTDEVSSAGLMLPSEEYQDGEPTASEISHGEDASVEVDSDNTPCETPPLEVPGAAVIVLSRSRKRRQQNESGATEPDSGVEQQTEREDTFFHTQKLTPVDIEEVDPEVVEQISPQVAPPVLSDQRCAPEAVVPHAKLLDVHWSEESPVALRQTLKTVSNENVEANASPVELGDGVDKTIKPPPLQQSHRVTGSSDAMRSDPNEGKELRVQPPPKPSPSAPPKLSSPPKTLPKPPSLPAQNEAPSVESDIEIEGLVQELLDEEKRDPRGHQPRPEEINQENWFEWYFAGHYLRTLPEDWSFQTAKDAEFIEQSLAVKKEGRILDLACGTGRHTIELSQRGYTVIGLDYSLEMLRLAVNRSKQQGLVLKFVQGDMRELNFASAFDACFLWHTSFGYFDNRTNLKVLQGVHRALKAKGRFLLDVMNRDYVLAHMPARLWWEGKGCVFLEESELDYLTSILQTKRTLIFEDGTPPVEQYSYIRLYSAHELSQMLNAAGFSIMEISGERFHRGQFLGNNSKRLIVLAQKHSK